MYRSSELLLYPLIKPPWLLCYHLGTIPLLYFRGLPKITDYYSSRPMVSSLWKSFLQDFASRSRILFGGKNRSDRIWTNTILIPNQEHYQIILHSVVPLPQPLPSMTAYSGLAVWGWIAWDLNPEPFGYEPNALTIAPAILLFDRWRLWFFV